MADSASTGGSGRLVRARSAQWRIVQVVRHIDCGAVDLAGIDAGNVQTRRTLLTPFDRLEPIDTARRPLLVGRRRWRHALAALATHDDPFGGLSCAIDLPIALHAWQLAPALAVLGGHACRVLLADEVGLGKTIQAGLLLTALALRGEAARVLILAPAGLREQWAAELTSHFRLAATVVDARHLHALAGRLPRGLNPWTLPGISISSFDYLKRPEVLRGLSGVTWDLLLIDEAHAVAGDTERAAAARLLAASAQRVLLLTATPHAGDDDEFASLCAIGRLPGPSDAPLLMFRRTRAQVDMACNRRVNTLQVRQTAEEADLHLELERYAQAVWAEGDRSGRLAALVLRKRAFSSAGSLVRSLARRLGSIGGGDSLVDAQLALPFSASGAGDSDDRDEEPDVVLSAPGLRDRLAEAAWLRRLLSLARTASRRESKLHALTRLIARTREPVIVFTEYRDTLIRIRRRLQRLTDVAVVHGGLSGADRQCALQAFARGDARVLVATDAAGEGLNLQARCRCVIALELPWSPRRLEQRIGRVDRIGQTRRVHAVLLMARRTAETDVLGRLVHRMNRIRRALGDDGLAPGDDEIARAVMLAAPATVSPRTAATPADADDLPHTAPAVAHVRFAGPADDERARAEGERLAALRRLAQIATGRCESATIGAALDRRRPWVSVDPLAASRLVNSLLIVVRTCVRSAWARVDTRVMVVRAPIPARIAPRRRAEARAVFDHHSRETVPALAAAAQDMLARHLPRVAAEHERARVLASDRARDLLRSLDARDAGLLVQGSLFDREALRAAEVRTRDSTARRASLQRHLDRLASSTLVPGEVDVLLCALTRCDWPHDGEEKT